MTKVLLVIVAVLAGAVLVLGLPAQAGAASLCEHRSAAHEAEHGGHEADNAWHIAHGDLPTCEPDESDGNGHRDDDKSRYCRRHIFC